MKIDFTQLTTQLIQRLKFISRYRVLLFIVFVVSLFGFLVLRINQAVNVTPAASSQTTTAQVATPRIDPKVVQQLQQLQDNNVSVQALFDQARTNPFQ